jgi:hypothetical protein
MPKGAGRGGERDTGTRGSSAAVEGAIRLLDRRTPPPHDGDIVETAHAATEKGA